MAKTPEPVTESATQPTDDHSTPSRETGTDPPTNPRPTSPPPPGANPLLRFGVPQKAQAPHAMLPLLRPPDDASIEEWEAYRVERRRRRIIKAERRGRIARRESPHDAKTCEQCMAARAMADNLLQHDIDVAEAARRSMMSREHVYRVISPNITDRRGLKTLTSMRRIAHDGLGISLDALALILELK